MNGRTAGIIIAVVAVLVVGVGVLVMNSKPSTDSTPTTDTQTNVPASPTQTTENNEPTSNQSENAAEVSGVIEYSNNGFSSGVLTVKSGSRVTVKNNSSRVLQFDSNPHPEHTDNPELNVGNISPGQSKTITVTKKGTHGYHNHANDDHTGTLVVE